MKKIRAFCEKSREVLSYLFFGVLTTLLNIVLYSLFQVVFGYNAANSWGNILNNMLCILFAYGTNRRWVFLSKTHGKEAISEFVKFVTCRLGTMLLDTAIMVVLGNWIGPALIEPQWLNLWGVGVKVAANVVVVVLNYIFSKKIIFKKEEKPAKEKKAK